MFSDFKVHGSKEVPMTVGESIRMEIEKAGGELITYYKIQSTGEFGITRLYINSKNRYYRNYFMLNDNRTPIESSKLLSILIGFDEFEPMESPYKIGNTTIMEDALEITEDKFFSQSGASKEMVLSTIHSNMRN